MRIKPVLVLSFVILTCTTGCNKVLDILDEAKDQHKPANQVVTYASGLTAPLGIEADAKGQLWVTEAGTGTSNDGQLSLITAEGKVFPVVKGFPSVVSPEGAVFGLNHILLKDGVLWMLHGVEGKLYKFNISTFKPGDPPRQANELEFEDIGSFVKNHDFPDDNNETDIYNLTVGPEGDLFIADAAANAVIRRRNSTGQLSVFATIPPISNPSGDPAEVQAVPTGIVFDGQKFLVCTFSGYPYPAKRATVYQLDLHGNPSVYQTGFSSLTDIELGVDQKPVVVEYGAWTGETFAENSGTFWQTTPNENKSLVTGLNFPNSVERGGPKTYYIAETYEGKILKVSLK